MRISDSSRRAAVLVAVVAVGLVAAGVATGLPGVAQMQQPSGEEVLDGVEQRYDDAETVTGTAEVTVTNDSETTEVTVEFATKDPDKVWVSATGDKNYEAGSNGSVVWAVGDDRSFAREITDEERDRFESMTDPVPEEDVDAEVVATTEIDGESAYVVELTPTDEDAEDVASTLWVAEDDSRVLRIESSHDDKETRIDVTEQQFDVSIHDSTFEPPEDRVSVTTTESYDSFEALASATEFDLPSYDGEFEAGQTISRADGEAAVQEYADGVTIITATGAADYLGEIDDGTSVSVDGEEATAVEREDRATVFWTDDEVTTGVVVEGDVDDAVAVAEEIR